MAYPVLHFTLHFVALNSGFLNRVVCSIVHTIGKQGRGSLTGILFTVGGKYGMVVL